MRVKLISNYLFLMLIAFHQPALSQEGASSSRSTNFLVAPTLFYTSGIRTRNSNDEESRFLWELRAAYRFHTDFFAGLFYQGDEENIKSSGYSSSSLNGTTLSQRNGWGPVVGYITSSVHFTLAYHFSSELKYTYTNSGNTTDYIYKGSGFQLDLGYKIPLFGGFFGPQISYKNFTYPKLKTGSESEQDISPELKEAKFDPSIVYYFFF